MLGVSRLEPLSSHFWTGRTARAAPSVRGLKARTLEQSFLGRRLAVAGCFPCCLKARTLEQSFLGGRAGPYLRCAQLVSRLEPLSSHFWLFDASFSDDPIRSLKARTLEQSFLGMSCKYQACLMNCNGFRVVHLGEGLRSRLPTESRSASRLRSQTWPAG